MYNIDLKSNITNSFIDVPDIKVKNKTIILNKLIKKEINYEKKYIKLFEDKLKNNAKNITYNKFKITKLKTYNTNIHKSYGNNINTNDNFIVNIIDNSEKIDIKEVYFKLLEITQIPDSELLFPNKKKILECLNVIKLLPNIFPILKHPINIIYDILEKSILVNNKIINKFYDLIDNLKMNNIIKNDMFIVDDICNTNLNDYLFKIINTLLLKYNNIKNELDSKIKIISQLRNNKLSNILSRQYFDVRNKNNIIEVKKIYSNKIEKMNKKITHLKNQILEITDNSINKNLKDYIENIRIIHNQKEIIKNKDKIINYLNKLILNNRIALVYYRFKVKEFKKIIT